MEPLTLLYKPLPYPTLEITVKPLAERTWILRHWYAPIVIVHVIFFAIYLALLIYYLRNVLAADKEIANEEKDVYDDDNDERDDKIHVEARESKWQSTYNPLQQNAQSASSQERSTHRRNAKKAFSNKTSANVAQASTIRY